MSHKRDGEDFRHESAEELSGAEHFLVGVSPQYWSHTPMSIRSLHELGLVDGMDCLVVKNQTRSTDSHEENRSHDVPKNRKRTGVDDNIPSATNSEAEVRFIPVSKCELHGVIVNADRKSNGSCLYLLDDGTGVVDCIQWVDNAMYSLPPLVPSHDQHGPNGTFRVGDIVRVLGKIKCASIGRTRESLQVYRREWKVQDCDREVHITSMSSVPLNSQSNHWLRCLQFARRALIDSERVENTHTFEADDSDHDSYLVHRRLMADQVRNGPDVLRLLGPEISSKAVQRADFPAPDDAYGAWRVFGVGCRCDLPYLNSLLYCHCQATVVALDPHFKFRDALLELLLQMESDVVNHSTNGQSIENGQLRFQYKAIVGNATLQRIAMHAVVNENNVAVSVDRLFLQTFAALRKDGIVSLLDDETDTYLLVSRERVLEPHCKKLLQKTDSSSLERRVLQTAQPAYLRNVANCRLQYVKKTLTDNR